MNVMTDRKVGIEGESVHHECDDGQKKSGLREKVSIMNVMMDRKVGIERKSVRH